MSAFEVRPVKDSEVGDYVRTMFWSAGRSVDNAFIEEQRNSFELARALAAFEGNELIGTIGIRSLHLTLPGGAAIPIAAIGQGGVLPPHTRKGVMRGLMLRALDAAREREEPLAAWTTSEWPLYERYGGGVATFSSGFLIRGQSRDALRSMELEPCDVRLTTAKDILAILPDLHRIISKRPGGVPRDDRYWKTVIARLEGGRSLDVLESRVDFPKPFYCVVRNSSGEVEACVAYRIHQFWESGLFRSQMDVQFLLCATENASRAIWKFLFGIDLVDSIHLPHRPVSEPLRWLMKDGRRLETQSCQDHIWLRVLEPIAVFSQRQIPQLSEPLRIRAVDPLETRPCQTMDIMSDGEMTSVAYSSKEPEIELDIGTLSSLILGGVSVWSLASAGRIRANSHRALARLAYAVESVEPPFTDTDF